MGQARTTASQRHVLLGKGSEVSGFDQAPHASKDTSYHSRSPELCGDLTLDVSPPGWWGGDS